MNIFRELPAVTSLWQCLARTVSHRATMTVFITIYRLRYRHNEVFSSTPVKYNPFDTNTNYILFNLSLDCSLLLKFDLQFIFMHLFLIERMKYVLRYFLGDIMCSSRLEYSVNQKTYFFIMVWYKILYTS